MPFVNILHAVIGIRPVSVGYKERQPIVDVPSMNYVWALWM